MQLSDGTAFAMPWEYAIPAIERNSLWAFWALVDAQDGQMPPQMAADQPRSAKNAVIGP
jgi:hypothetical protein